MRQVVVWLSAGSGGGSGVGHPPSTASSATSIGGHPTSTTI